MKDRRHELRHPVARRPATVTVISDFRHSLHCEIFDISSRGMRLWVGWPIPTGSAVRIAVVGLEIEGQIRYCNRASDHYYVGVQLEQLLTPTYLQLIMLGDSSGAAK